MSKNIIRTIKDKNNPYVTINKTVLNDQKISWQAKGVHCYMLSKPDDWVFHRDELASHATNGITSLKSILKELGKNDYLRIWRERDDKGRTDCWHTLVFETKELAIEWDKTHTEQGFCPEVDFPLVDNPPVGNQPLLNNDLTNNEKKLKKERDVQDELEPLTPLYEKVANNSNQQFDEWWSKYPKKQKKAEARKLYSALLKSGKVSHEEMMAGIDVLRSIKESNSDDKFKEAYPLAPTWLRGERWADEKPEEGKPTYKVGPINR